MTSSGSNPAELANDVREPALAWVMASTSLDMHPATFHTTGLPALEAALNVERMSASLAPLLPPALNGRNAQRASSLPLIVRYARLLDYKHGNRGLVQYELERPGGNRKGEERLMVFGKLYPDLAQATRVYGIMRELWGRVFAHTAGYGVPQPLGCVPELSMLVYVPVKGQLLNELILSDEAPRYLRLAGAWLGILHRSQLRLERRFQLAPELVNVTAWSALIGSKYPSEAEAAAHIARYLNELALPEGGLASLMPGGYAEVPLHKDFHYAHVIVNSGLEVIDFDEMRLGDANFDLAHFCANLYLLAYRKSIPLDRLATLQRAFLDEYARDTSWVEDPRFTFFYAYTCLKIAKQISTARGPCPRPDGEEQLRQVRLMLAEGLRAGGIDT